MNKVLTIIVPAYNMEKYLERCLSSLLVDASLMRRFEVLVVNDGSKDNTSSIAHKFEKDFPDTFRTIDKENGHYGSCINRGLSEAKGIFVKILDADDAFDRKAFSDFLTYLMKEEVHEKAELILTDYRIVDEFGKSTRDVCFNQYNSPFTYQDITPTDTMEWFIHGITYRLDILRQIDYKQTEGISYTDAEWIIFPLRKIKSLYRCECILYQYTMGRMGQSVSKESRVKNSWMQVNVLKKITEKMNNELPVKDEQFSFMQALLLREFRSVYQLQLLTYHSSFKPYKKLLELDTFLRLDSKEIYNILANYSTTIAGFRFTPIADWRNNCPRLVIAQQLYSTIDFLNSCFRRRFQ